MKVKTLFVCQSCGAESPRWVGKCSNCGNWNSLVEEKVDTRTSKSKVPSSAAEPVLLSDVLFEEESRFTTQVSEFDRVMGGGIVPGSVTLIGGDPGIGKSTLSLQAATALSRKDYKVLYVSGEESVKQTTMRAQRLTGSKADMKKLETLYMLNELDVSVILDQIAKMKPDVVVIDSIQVVFSPEIGSTPGSVSQVRECSAILTQMAKSKGIALFIIGHVTKEGMLAGPRVLEHIVDTVLYFEGERYSTYRILRATKNRFGSTNEIGVFEMTSCGLEEVVNPSEIFLAERPTDTSGSVVVPMMEGTRPFLVEIQGLVSRASFGVVRQKAQGFEQNRLALLIAVLEKRLNLNLQDKDVFLNVVGGVKVVDPAADLAVVVAVASAFLDRPVPSDTVVLGEVGLSSEVRSVSHLVTRINEAAKLGFKTCIVPANNLKSKVEIDTDSIEVVPASSVKEVLNILGKR